MIKKLNKLSLFAAAFCMSACNSIAPVEARHLGTLTTGGGGGGGLEVYSGPGSCATPPTTWSGTTYYLDLTNGNDSNNGLAPGVGHAFKTWAHATSVMNPAASDTLKLATGNYGNVSLSATNTQFNRVIPDTGQTPSFTQIQLSGAKWVIQGLTFRGLRGGTGNFDIFIPVSGHDQIIDSNNIASTTNAAADVWNVTQRFANAHWEAIEIDSGSFNSATVKCFAVTNNIINNTQAGIVDYAANSVLIKGNTLSRIGSGDDLDVSSSNVELTANIIQDSIDDGSGNHSDCLQGQIGRAPTGSNTYDNILINGNQCLEKYTAGLTLTSWNSAAGNEQQGITAFDENWTNITIINNKVINSSFWGIGWNSCQTCTVANNTTLPTNVEGISVGTSHAGSNSSSVRVFNNITYSLDQAVNVASVTFDHNTVKFRIHGWFCTGAETFLNSGTCANANTNIFTSQSLNGTLITSYDTTTPLWNTILPTGSNAIGAGTATGAPNKLDGTPRTGTVNNGDL